MGQIPQKAAKPLSHNENHKIKDAYKICNRGPQKARVGLFYSEMMSAQLLRQFREKIDLSVTSGRICLKMRNISGLRPVLHENRRTHIWS